MSMLDLRPKVTSLSLSLFARPIHPELYDTRCSKTLIQDLYTAQVHLTTTGHVLSLQLGELSYTEIAGGLSQPLPQQCQLLRRSLSNNRSSKLQCDGVMSYQVSHQVEVLPPHLFWKIQEELVEEGNKKNSLLFRFGGETRLDLGAIGCVSIEPRREKFLLHTFHTFPTDYAVIKTQSLFNFQEALVKGS